METLLQDIGFAIRSFMRSPRFALTALLTIALAIGGATAVFSIVDRSLLRPLPYHSPDRLVSVGIVAPVINTQDWLFAGTYLEWRTAASSTFEAMTAWKGVSDCDGFDTTPKRLSCAVADHDFLPTLGLTPAQGRNFSAAEDRPEADPVALISHLLWQTRYGGDPAILSKRIAIDGVSTRIIGVLPRNFETPSLAAADVLLPLRLRQGFQRQRVVHTLGRLRPEVSEALARAQLAPLFQQFLQSAPADFRKAVPMQLRLGTVREQQTRNYRLALWMIFAAVLAFVCLACANVANLLLARSAARRHEFAIRVSLGASRGRLARQALTESTVLGMAGGAAGSLFAFALLRLCQAAAPAGDIRLQQAALDGRVLAFAATLSIGAALVFGLAPASAVARPPVRSRTWLRSVLVAAQLGISVVLLTGTCLFLLSLRNLQQVRLGLQPESVVTASFILPEARYKSLEKQIAFFGLLEQTLEDDPRFSHSAITDSLPPGGDPRSRPYVSLIGGGDAAEKELEGLVKWRFVTPGYFETLRIPIKQGRAFTQQDRGRGREAIILSELLARRLFPGENAVGKQIRGQTQSEIIGIAADVRNAGLQGVPDPEMYCLRGSAPDAIWKNARPPYGWRQAIAIARSTRDPRTAAQALQSSIQKIDPTLAVVTGSLPSHVGEYLARPQFQTALLSLFALLGLILAAVGLYGLVSFIEAERTGELGVRMALGATPAAIIRMMLKEGLAWTAAGASAGLAASLITMRWLQSLLFEVQPLDLRALTFATGTLALVAFVAIWVPSRRAARLDPMAALRRD